MRPTFPHPEPMTLPLMPPPHPGIVFTAHLHSSGFLYFAFYDRLLCGTPCKGKWVDTCAKELLDHQPQSDSISVLNSKTSIRWLQSENF